MSNEILIQIALFYGVLLISLVVHEASHAVVALWGGDPTAYHGGQVTLNPAPHIRREPFGTVILPLVMLVMSKGSWCMGYAHAPVDPAWAARHPLRAALMSAAGPISNILLAALAFLILKSLLWAELADPFMRSSGGVAGFYAVEPIDPTDGLTVAAIRIASAMLLLNVVLAILNLIPLPPLDGAGIVEGLFPRTLGRVFGAFRSQPFLMPIVMIIVLFRVLPSLYRPVLSTVLGWI